jgi:hypothetical protein
LRLSRPQGRCETGRIRSIEKCSDLIGNRTRDHIFHLSQAFCMAQRSHSNDNCCGIVHYEIPHCTAFSCLVLTSSLVSSYVRPRFLSIST